MLCDLFKLYQKKGVKKLREKVEHVPMFMSMDCLQHTRPLSTAKAQMDLLLFPKAVESS